ncbi:MAG TPA: universal stress protein [Acidobacteriaceae bacterium]|nr:universal stress protein [Acidobacteriaceae bacterium]
MKAQQATTPQIKDDSGNRAFTAPDHIILASDLADLDYLIPHAIAQCWTCESSLTIAHIIPDKLSGSLDEAVALIADTSATHSQRTLQEAGEKLSVAAGKIRSAGINCFTTIRHGQAHIKIQELIREVRAGRVILGTHGRRNVKKFFLGSTAHEILKTVSVPVLTVGPHARLYAHGEPHRILHPVSLTSGYQETAQLAVKMGQFYRAEITLLHVLPAEAQSEYAEERLMQWTNFELGRLIPDEAPLWTTATTMVEEGDIVGKILATAEKLEADLIIMGANSDSSFWPVYGDNTVYNVIAEARCPVLTLRHSHRPEESSPAKSSCVLI